MPSSLAEAGDVVRPPEDRADQCGRAALGGVDDVPREMRVREERVEGGGELPCFPTAPC